MAEESFVFTTEKEKIKVCWIDKLKGNGLFAKTFISKGELIFEDDPILHIQFISNKKLVHSCSHCLRFIGSLQETFDKLISIEDEQTHFILPLIKECSPKMNSPFPCRNNCGSEEYCCKECELKSYFQYHQVLCPNSDFFSTSSHQTAKSLLELKSYILENEFDLIELGLRVYGMLLQTLIQTNGNWTEAWKPFFTFCQTSWIALQPNLQEAKKIVLHSLNLIQQSLGQLLKERFESRFDYIFELDFFDKVLGFIQTNAAEMKIYSPLEEYFANLQSKLSLNEVPSSNLNELLQIIPFINQIHKKHGKFVYALGAGLFSFHHYLNHSCLPNAENGSKNWKTAPTQARVTIYAIQDIQPNEEINISYVSDQYNLGHRQSILQERYGFKCSCLKCKEEQEKLNLFFPFQTN